MVECIYSCFDRILYMTKKLPTTKINEGIELMKEFSFSELLDFCVENKCFSKEQSQTIYEGIVMWEDLDGNYFEEDTEKYNRLMDSIGITEELYRKYSEV